MDFSLSEAQTEIAGLARKILAEQDSAEAGHGSGSGRTSPRLACSPPGCPSRSAARASASSSSARCSRRPAGPRRRSPYLSSIVLGAGAIAAFGTADQQRRWAAPAGDGSVVLTAALAEEDSDDPASPSTRAERTTAARGRVAAVRREDGGARACRAPISCSSRQR